MVAFRLFAAVQRCGEVQSVCTAGVRKLAKTCSHVGPQASHASTAACAHPLTQEMEQLFTVVKDLTGTALSGSTTDKTAALRRALLKDFPGAGAALPELRDRSEPRDRDAADIELLLSSMRRSSDDGAEPLALSYPSASAQQVR